MTTTVVDTAQLPDLESTVPCECLGESHAPQGCQREAHYRASNPCGHQAQLLCGECVADLKRVIAEGCPDCGGVLSCLECDAEVDVIVVVPL